MSYIKRKYGDKKMSQEVQIQLTKRQKELLIRFFEFAQKDNDNDYCVPMYNANGELFLFEKDARKYQKYGYYRILRFMKKKIFFIKVKKVKKDRKFLCMKENIADYVKLYLES